MRTIDRPDPYRGARGGGVRALDQLRPGPDCAPGAALSQADHAGCPGHVAWLDHSWRTDQPVTIVHGCEDWVRYGHADRYATTGRPTSGGAAAGSPMSESRRPNAGR